MQDIYQHDLCCRWDAQHNCGEAFRQLEPPRINSDSVGTTTEMQSVFPGARGQCSTGTLPDNSLEVAVCSDLHMSDMSTCFVDDILRNMCSPAVVFF
jgi:hypothetical protein